MKKLLRHIFLIIGWLLLGVIGLLIVAGLLIQTKPVKQKIARIAEKQASQVVNGTISISNISGNLFTNLTIDNLLWNFQNDTLAYIKSFDATYQLLPLLHGELLIESVLVTEPYFQLKQENDSTWNVQQLISDAGNTKSDTAQSAGNFQLNLLDFKLVEGRLNIHTVDTIIPKKVNDLNVKLALEFNNENLLLQLNEVNFKTYQPDFNIVQLSLELQQNDQVISLRDFHLKTAKNEFDGQAAYSNDRNLDISVEMETAPINLNEFEFFVPNLNLPAKPEIDFKTQTVNGNQQLSISLTDVGQSINLDVVSNNFSQYITNTKNTLLQYDISGELENIDLAHWLGNPELNYTVTGKIALKGEGTNPKTANINFDGDFWDCLLAERPVDELKINLHLDNGDLSGDISGQGNFGIISLTPDIKSLQTSPAYQLRLLTKNLNLAPLIGNDSLKSNINLKAAISGKGFDPENLNASAGISMMESEMFDLMIDSLEGQFTYNKKNIVIDSLWAKALSVQLKAEGNYHLDGNTDVNIWAQIDSVQPFWKYIPLDSLYASGEINARLKGTTDSMLLNTNVGLQDVNYSGLTANKLVINGDGKRTKNDTAFSANIIAEKLNAGNFLIDSITTSAKYFTDSILVQAKVASDEINSKFTSEVVLGEIIEIQLFEWEVDYKNQHLELFHSPAIIELDSQIYRVSNFKMASSKADTAQFISANGTISQTANEDFEIEVANVDISALLESIDQQQDVSGKFNLMAKLQGAAENPSLNGSFSIDSALAYGYRFTELGGDFNFDNSRLNFEGQIVPDIIGRFDLKANLPVTARLDSMNFSINKEDTISGVVSIDSFPLSVIKYLEDDERIKGSVNGKINVGGTFNKPEPIGNISLKNAEVIIPQYGIDYRNIILDVSFSENAAQLDSFFIKTEDGNLKASGTVDFSTAIYSGDVSQSEVSIQFNKFNPFNHRQFNMQLSGNTNLNGKAGEVVFSGDLEVPEAEIYLPAVMNMMGRINAPEIPEPLLVRELEQLESNTDTLSTVQKDTATVQADTLNIEYLDGFTGNLNIEIPSNTWIKNKDMFVEISGSLELIKNADYFELFGNIDVVRGQYDLLGKLFKIKEGTISFRGGEEIMPQINITASYSFRNSNRAQQELQVTVTGTANNPAVNFTLDGSNISEGDALSYILFGRGMNELTIEQQENVSGAGQLASKAAMSVLSSQLTDILGRSLDVDYIEVKGDGDFDNATVVVGKYITNDLFVSYEQRFGEIDEKEMSKYEVKLEYELFKFLFLQLNNSSNESGFDVIFKLNSK